MTAGPHWTAGDVIVVRHQWRGRVWHAHPAIVVDDSSDPLVLFKPAGAVRQVSNFDYTSGQIAPPVPKPWYSTDALVIIPVGAEHAVSLFWQERGGPFLCWYVDMQAPFRRAGGGIVTWDRTLDIVAAPDLAWRLKDEDQLARAVTLAWMTAEEADRVLAEARRVGAAMDARAPPFNNPWPDWRPDPTWGVPVLPEDWATTV